MHVARHGSPATVRDVVLSGFSNGVRIFPHQVVAPEHLARADQALARLGIAHLASRRVIEMSPGEVRRTVIARALVQAARALLFDEPGASLDVTAHAEVKRAMRELARTPLGLVLVTHDVSEIIPEIERIVLLREGRVFAVGPRGTVLTEANLREVFGMPVRARDPRGVLARALKTEGLGRVVYSASSSNASFCPR